MAKQVQIDDVRQWQSLRDQGINYNDVGNQTGWNPATVRKYLTSISFRPDAWYAASAFNDLSLFRVRDTARRHKLLKDLLLTEKMKRGVKSDRIVFLGIANVAEYFYCAMKSVLKSRVDEPMFFQVYLQDRLSYPRQLGRRVVAPTSPEALLDVGNDIVADDIEALLEVRAKIRRSTSYDATIPSVSDPTESPLVRGEHFHKVKAEAYPTIRWNFEKGGYVLIGVPDGITGEFVYEFKSSRTSFLMSFLKPVGLAQADLYGHFFRRKNKRVQLYTMESSTLDTLESPVDNEKVEKLLQDFRQVEDGQTPQPPKEWKCKKCEFRDICTLKVS